MGPREALMIAMWLDKNFEKKISRWWRPAAAVIVTDCRVADWDQFTVIVAADDRMMTDEKKILQVKIFSWDGLQKPLWRPCD